MTRRGGFWQLNQLLNFECVILRPGAPRPRDHLEKKTHPPGVKNLLAISLNHDRGDKSGWQNIPTTARADERARDRPGMWTSFGGSPRGNRTASADASVTRRMNYHEPT
jgi:hypothetical protein